MTRRPLIQDIRTLVDRKISEILETEGPDVELSMEKIMPAFESWVLPDHHLDAIRHRLEHWIRRRNKSRNR